MQHTSSIILALTLTLVACSTQQSFQSNPDPNHTHADFAIFVDGEMLDLSDKKYMSGLSYDEESHDEEDEYHHEHLHLHDNVGGVLHRHKSGLTLQEFFDSIDITFDDGPWRMYLRNVSHTDPAWEEVVFDLSYIFVDMDQILITNSEDITQLATQLNAVSEESCLYSRTCPWKGDPPQENCVADPEIPCVEIQ